MSLPSDWAARARASFWAWSKQKWGFLPVRGVRQRRPSENVKEHKDARSFLCVTAKRSTLRAAAEQPTALREDIEVSLELSFGICLLRRAGLKPGVYNSEARNAGKMPAVQNRNAPAGAGAQ